MAPETASALQQFLRELDQLASDARSAFAGADNQDAVEAARVEFLGARQGRLKAVQKKLGEVDPADRPRAGQHLNEVKEALQSALDEARTRLEQSRHTRQRDPQFDPSLPGIPVRLGHLHPITRTIAELKEIMGRK